MTHTLPSKTQEIQLLRATRLLRIALANAEAGEIETALGAAIAAQEQLAFAITDHEPTREELTYPHPEPQHR